MADPLPTFVDNSLPALSAANLNEYTTAVGHLQPGASPDNYVLIAKAAGAGGVQYVLLTDASIASGAGINADKLADGSTHVVMLATERTNLGNAILKTLVTAKGDLIVATASGAVTNLAVGSNSTVPLADSTQTAGVRWAAFIPPRVVALTYGTTVTPNCATTDIATMTFGTGNVTTMAAPSGTPVAGQKLIIRLKQDGAGSRTVGTWTGGAGGYRWPGGTAPTLTTTANKTDWFGFIYNNVDSIWDNVAQAQNI